MAGNSILMDPDLSAASISFLTAFLLVDQRVAACYPYSVDQPIKTRADGKVTAFAHVL